MAALLIRDNQSTTGAHEQCNWCGAGSVCNCCQRRSPSASRRSERYYLHLKMTVQLNAVSSGWQDVTGDVHDSCHKDINDIAASQTVARLSSVAFFDVVELKKKLTEKPLKESQSINIPKVTVLMSCHFRIPPATHFQFFGDLYSNTSPKNYMYTQLSGNSKYIYIYIFIYRSVFLFNFIKGSVDTIRTVLSTQSVTCRGQSRGGPPWSRMNGAKRL